MGTGLALGTLGRAQGLCLEGRMLAREVLEEEDMGAGPLKGGVARSWW